MRSLSEQLRFRHVLLSHRLTRAKAYMAGSVAGPLAVWNFGTSSAQ